MKDLGSNVCFVLLIKRSPGASNQHIFFTFYISEGSLGTGPYLLQGERPKSGS